MKAVSKLSAILADALLIMCGAVGTVCVVPTAFSAQFDIRLLLIAGAAAGLLLALWLEMPKRGFVFGLLFAACAIGFAVKLRADFVDGAKTLLRTAQTTMFTEFSFLPDLGAPSEGSDPVACSTVFLAVLTVLFALIISVALIRGKRGVLALLIPVPLLLTSLIYTDLQPALWAIILLAVYFGGVLIGCMLRRAPSPGNDLLRALTLIPLAGLAALVYFISPREQFVPIPFEQRQQFFGERIETLQDKFLGMSSRNPTEYSLARQGDRTQNYGKLFEIQASEPGVYLLRSHSYGRYGNGSWLPAPEYKGDRRSMEALGAVSHGPAATLSIRDSFSGERYVPYGFLADESAPAGESFIRSLGKTEYSWKYRNYTSAARAEVSFEEEQYIDFIYEQYTMPDCPERDELLSFIAEHYDSLMADDYQIALDVAAMVREGATYSLTPGLTPEGKDFVLYFLEENKQGYCVHFASATTALLQALGIPARYTIGCRGEIPTANEWVEWQNWTSHAWTEVYIWGLGWVPIESTAGFEGGVPGLSLAEPSIAPTTDPFESPDTTQRPYSPDMTPLPRGSIAPTEPPESTRKPNATAAPGGVQEPVGGDTAPGRKALWLLCLPAMIGAWLAVGALIRRRREASYKGKNTRRAVLALARAHRRLERFGIPACPRLSEWEQEAAFSDHPMARQRKRLYRRLKTIRRGLKRKKPLLWFLLERILLVL